MRVIYVAGAYRADTKYGVYMNIRRAEAVAIKLWEQGWCVLCPHLNSQLFNEVTDLPAEVFLSGGLEFVRRSDAVYMMRGWEESQGSQAELELAMELGLEIIFEEVKDGSYRESY